jgi:hypothetical protein
MQRTRDKVGLHGQSLRREPLIATVRQQEAQSQSRRGAKLLVVTDALQHEW